MATWKAVTGLSWFIKKQSAHTAHHNIFARVLQSSKQPHYSRRMIVPSSGVSDTSHKRCDSASTIAPNIYISKKTDPKSDGKDRIEGRTPHSHEVPGEESRRIVTRLKKLSTVERQKLFDTLRNNGKADVYHYTSMISFSENSAQAEKVFLQMNEAGIHPNTVTFNTLLRKLIDDGRFSCAEILFKRMLTNSGMVPDQHTLCTMINGYSKAGKIDRAEYFYSKLMDQGLNLDTVSYNTAIAMLCRSGKPDEAEKIISEMDAKGVKANAKAYTVLISSFGKIGRPDDSLRIFALMKSNGISGDIPLQNALMHALSINNRLPNAEELAHFITQPLKENRLSGQDSRDLEGAPSNSMSTGPRALPPPARKLASQQDTAQDLEDRAPPQASPSGSHCGDVLAVTSRIGALSRDARVADAERVFARMERQRIRPNAAAYNAIIKCCTCNGRLDLAKRYYERMLDSGIDPDEHTLRFLIDGSELAGDTLAAMDWVSEAVRRRVAPFCSFTRWETRPGSRGRVLVVDLHRLSALSARVAVQHVLASRRLDPWETELVFITGKGRHSPAGPVVGPAVTRLLEREGFAYTRAEGNTGRVVLRRPAGFGPTVALCLVLVVLMWVGAALVASDSIRRMAARAAEGRRLRAELCSGLAEHVQRNREPGGPGDPRGRDGEGSRAVRRQRDADDRRIA